LARLSARDLHELSELNPFWPNYFDKRNIELRPHGLPTDEQCQQWESYLFYGDKTISLTLEDRGAECWLSAARDLCSNWPEFKAHLNLEIGLECLCVLIALNEHPQVKGKTERLTVSELDVLADIKEDLLNFFHDSHIEIDIIYQRTRQVLGLIE